jgi:pyruvate dehydrogenase E2 component (dihydrolipoamide acetyltransferase)
MPIQILMPALSPTMTEGNLVKWLKKEGEEIESGDVLAEIETDKATMEIEAIDEGVLAKIVVPDATEGVKVNQLIAIILEEGEDAGAADATAPAPAPRATAAPSPTPMTTPRPLATETGDRVSASPLARRMAVQAGLDLAALSGSGPQGRVVKTDIEAALSGGGASPVAAVTPAAALSAPSTMVGEADYAEVPNSMMRKVIAQRLSQAKRDIPHFYLSADCAVDALMALRKDLNAKAPEGEGAYKLSLNDFVVRAVALALRKVPAANATWTNEAVRLYSSIDVSVAVATPGGLITPVIRDADNKGLAQISAETRDMAGRAREGKLMPGEYQGGGFTISNMGMYGVKEFSAIINPPQSCILAVGAAEQRPVVKDGALAIATVMTCRMSVDHRSVDGALAAQFMAAFKALIEEPLTMLL